MRMRAERWPLSGRGPSNRPGLCVLRVRAAEGQEALLLFQWFSVRSGAQHPAWQPAMARSCRWGRHGTTQQRRWKERNGSSAGLPSALGGLRAPPLCVLDAATYPSYTAFRGAGGLCLAARPAPK